MTFEVPKGLSLGLAQLLNAALNDARFRGELLRSPLEAATRLSSDASRTLGANVPDLSARLAQIWLTAIELAVLSRMPRGSANLQEFTQALVRLSFTQDR